MRMRNEKGMTLIEILMALSILAVGMLALATIFPTGYLRMNRAHYREEAIRLVEEGIEMAKSLSFDNITLEKLRAAHSRSQFAREYPYVDVNQDGVFSEFEQRTFQVQDDYPYSGMKMVRVTVTWLTVPPRDDDGDGIWDTERTTAIIYFDRFF